MSRLVLFKSNYEAQLKANVESGNISAYNGNTFNYDEKETLPTMFVIDDDICSRMFCDNVHEYEDAIILYDALKDIPDVMAADPTFWISLSHTVFSHILKNDGERAT